MTSGLRLEDAVVLVVHAHPDDEVFATGAATIAASSAGATVHLRVFTGGEGRTTGTSPEELAAARAAREQRLGASTRLLGISDWAYLSEPGRWTDTPGHPARTIAAAPVDDLATVVADALEALRPDVVLTVGPDGLTGHPDHVACHNAVRRATSTSRFRPRDVLGAVLDRQAVRAGHDLAVETFDRPIGSGGVVGARLSSPVTVAGPRETETRRRRALDHYIPGLGTTPVADLDVDALGSGDSLLLRFVLDAAGWGCDRFHRLP